MIILTPGALFPMIRPFRWLIFACVLGSVTSPAAPLPPPSSEKSTTLLPEPPRPPGTLRSPVEFFRQLLALSPEEQEAALALRGEPQREQIRAKLREYEIMPAGERELRLKAVELRWYLLPLMKMPQPERADWLAAIPEADRPLVEQRIQQWTMLPPELQKEVLDHETTIQYFVRLERSTPAQQEQILRSIPEGARQDLEARLAHWRAVPPEQRQRMQTHFHQFFDLSEKEKEKTLEALSETERRHLEKSLESFAHLEPAERRVHLEAFRKFSNLTPEGRTEFLHNARRWNSMTPRERELVRTLIHHAPPLPPGGPPPLPGDARFREAASNAVPALPGDTRPLN
jgi:hypothetical protein